MKKYSLPSLFVLFTLLIAACAPQATPAPVQNEQPTAVPAPTATPEPIEEAKTIVDIAVEDGRFTTLVAALEAADLAGALQGDGPFTVFAPTDDAFAALPEGTVEGLLADTDALSNVLLYHVVEGQVMAPDVLGLDGQEVETLSTESILITIDGDKVMINESTVIIPDIEASNGVIHVIDQVLLPPAPEEAMEESDEMMEEAKTIVDIAVEDGRFTTVVAALEAAGLVEALQGAGPFTVFAPTDDAFAALPEGTVEGLLGDPVALANVLLYHVVDGKVMAEDALGLDGQKVETLSGETILITIDSGSVMINESTVIIPDIEASNGVIHVIDQVLLPPAPEEAMEEAKTIVDIAVEDGRFTTLVAALEAAGLVDALQADGPYTVFAPTDEAFAALPEGTIEALLADSDALSNVLLYHVAEGKAMAADVVALDGQKVETLQGQYVDISVDGDNVMIDEALVIIPDIEASNGVIHVIDSVILPESRSVAEIAVEDGRFTTLVAALEAAGLAETMASEGSFTVFAPTDDAFAALPAGTVEGLLADIDALTNVLLYHVVDGKVMAMEVIGLDGQQVETLSGETILITIDGESVKINESTVIIPDIEASNGVIHVIDAVLIP